MTDNTNYVTPEEAQTKWCPIQNPPLLCVGTECMAWRWRHLRFDVHKDPEIDSWPAIYSTTHGYCGMRKS